MGFASSALTGFCFPPLPVLAVFLAEVVLQGLLLREAVAAEEAEVELDPAGAYVSLPVAHPSLCLPAAAA